MEMWSNMNMFAVICGQNNANLLYISIQKIKTTFHSNSHAFRNIRIKKCIIYSFCAEMIACQSIETFLITIDRTKKKIN